MNTRKPTKKEVPDEVKCWFCSQDGSAWFLMTGKYTRYQWDRDRKIRCYWLPFDAIPLPPQTKTTKGRKA